MNRITIIATATLAAACSSALAQMGPNLDLSWNTMDSGGGASAGGTFEISGTVGQHDAGPVMTGGGFELSGGFWPGVADACYPDCNGAGGLTIADFACFQAKFAAADPYADCNASGSLTIADFGCFQSRFAAGCP
jgi:hypothetical protein